MVLGIILGPLFEENFMRSWRMGLGEINIFREGRTALFLWFLFALTIFGPPIIRNLRRVLPVTATKEKKTDDDLAGMP